METKITACRMPVDLRDWLDAEAKKEGRSTANMMIWIIERYRKKVSAENNKENWLEAIKKMEGNKNVEN